jgi:hypothetical protein
MVVLGVASLSFWCFVAQRTRIAVVQAFLDDVNALLVHVE